MQYSNDMTCSATASEVMSLQQDRNACIIVYMIII